MSSPRTTQATGEPADVTEVGFPRLSARTLRFTLGTPSAVTVSADGSRVLFLRSRSGTQATGLLWAADVADGQERLLADPHELLSGDHEDLPAAERARRERMRQGGAGVTAFSTDSGCDQLAVGLSGRVFVIDVATALATEVPVTGPAVDPRLSPDGAWVAYHCDGGLHVAPATGDVAGHALVVDADDAVTWGLSDFAHAEELHRLRSFWWSPDSASLLVARVDETAVTQVSIADAAHPERPAATMRYPFAGGTNASTTLWRVGLDGSRTEVSWNHDAFEYLVDVRWDAGHDALITVLDRHQRTMRVLGWQPGETPRRLGEISDPAWVDVVPGVPAWWGERLLTVQRDVEADVFRLVADGVALTPPDVSVASVAAVDGDSVLVVVTHEERETRLGRVHADGRWEVVNAGEQTAAGMTPGMTTGTAAGGTLVVRRDTLDSAVPSLVVTSAAGSFDLAVHVVRPPVQPRRTFLPREHADDPRIAVLLPEHHDGSALPVLLDPYGGPHGQRVVAAARAYLESQWWAEQGYAVVVADGPGTPGSPSWQRAMSGDFAGPALAAQVRALEMVAERFGDSVDIGRVAIRGWSFGGYLAALCVLERPDLVHAAVVGAPVTDWALYDTAYTERYLGLPADHPGRYEAQSLLERASTLSRPVLMIHGLADDNVLVANTLRLSSALLAAGREHRVLPLSGVTHMTPQEVVAENLLLAQRDFLTEALAR
ncbi:MAG: prolyl oligopeptidase family serine peptidase [Jiangellales bacterium]